MFQRYWHRYHAETQRDHQSLNVSEAELPKSAQKFVYGGLRQRRAIVAGDLPQLIAGHSPAA
jgi:hypothetical protein